MSSFVFLKNNLWGTVLRTYALMIILLITISIFPWLPIQVHKLKQGRVEGISFRFETTSGVAVGDSASLEYQGISGEVVVAGADKEAMELGIFPESIVLNSEALTIGEIGTPVILLVKYGDLPVREITVIRRQPYSFFPTLSDFLGLSPLVRLYFTIIFLYMAVIFTGIGSIVAFWFKSDAWLAFFMLGAITNFFIPTQARSPSWFLFWSYFPAGLILFLLLFPNGKLNPKWSWMLVFLPLSKNILNNGFGRGYLPILPDYVSGFWFQHRLHIFLVIASILAYRYRKEFAPTERRRMVWLMLGLILISTRQQVLAFLGASPGFIQMFNGFSLWPYGGIANVFLSSLFSSGVATSLLLLLGVFSYRYRNTFTPLMRQQAKWLVLGISTFILLGTILKIFSASYFRFIQQNQSDAAVKLYDKVFILAIVFLIFCIVSALRHYRLWDVDIFINRVLVYGGVTITVGLICQLSVTFINRTIGSATANQSAFLIFPIAIFLIVITYKPVHIWLQKLADKYFPLERINFLEAFLEFTPDLRGYFTASRLSKVLAEKSVEQMEVTYASVFLKNTSGRLQHIKTAFTGEGTAQPVIDKQMLSKLEEGELIVPDLNSNYSIIIPLAVPRGRKKNIIGALLLGSRLNELGYSTEMKKSLKEFGEEAGKSLYIAQIKRQR